MRRPWIYLLTEVCKAFHGELFSANLMMPTAHINNKVLYLNKKQLGVMFANQLVFRLIKKKPQCQEAE